MDNNYASVGFTVDLFQGIKPARIIRGLKLLGVDFFELTPSIFDDVTGLLRVKNITSAFHLPILQGDGFDFSCPAKSSEIDTLVHHINKFKNDLSIHHVIAHPPEIDPTSKIKTDEKFWLVNLKRLATPVFLENVPSYSPDRFEAVYSRAQNFLKEQLLGICYDAAHHYLSGMDPAEQFLKIKNRTGCIHLSDCLPDDDAHLPFHSGGVLPIEQLLGLFKKTDYRGYVTLEIKPKSIRHVNAFFNSYFLALKYLNYKKYLAAKLRFWLLQPVICYYKKSMS